VDFSVDVEDCSSDRESTRLQRRDTPHHLKNKRVNTSGPPLDTTGQQQPQQADDDDGSSGTVTAGDTEDRVRRILARQIVKLCESFDSGSTSEVSQPPGSGHV